MKNIKLDPEEKKILAAYNKGEWQSDTNLKIRLKSLRSSAVATTKSKNINIRLQPSTLEKLRDSAARLGMPYQTLASSILHRYATGQTIVPNT